MNNEHIAQMIQVARNHVIAMEHEYPGLAKEILRNSMIIGEQDGVYESHYSGSVRTTPCEVILISTDSVEAAFYAGRGKTCILNFASYKHPGGGFLNGMMAQEEALCHASNLFNVLSLAENEYYRKNQQDLNRGLYRHRAVYTPNVVFNSVGGRTARFDVLTCAAPNWSAAGRYGRVTKEENDKVMDERVAFMLESIGRGNPDTIVLGAWGCGVFKQNPTVVATSMKKWLEKMNVATRIVIAIPNKTSANYKAFEKVFADVI